VTLYGDFLNENHRRVHKWYQYFPAYETHFERFRNRHVTVFEIGVGEGGSLQQWRRYLGPFAIIVGMDIYPRCRQVEEDQVHVRIGNQIDLEFLRRVVAEFGPPDIVIDDGSHIQAHVNKTFEFLYPLVAKNGVYLVEDLHAAYWADHGGGLRGENSFIETAKNYVDKMHAHYTGGAMARSATGDRTTSIHFYDSVVVFEVGEYRVMANRMTGDPALFDQLWAPPDYSREAFGKVVEEALRSFEPPGPQHVPAATTAVAVASQDSHALQAEIELLRASTSWRITGPLRAIGRLVKGPRPAASGQKALSVPSVPPRS
jgi:hypothetical protein